MSNETWKPDIFEDIFQLNADPWDFENSLYEQQKLEKVLQCLPASPIFFAVELGCAIGVSTLALAKYCKRIVGIDASETALAIAQQRCVQQKHISFIKAFLPQAYPASEVSGCDLVLISEVLYFFSPADIQCLAESVTKSLKPEGNILIVNWTGPTDTPCTGDEAAEYFIRVCLTQHWRPDYSERGKGYRIDRLIHGARPQKGNIPYDGEN
ncbi:methyltransferase domain-containing protein [Acetobacter oryzoeni]|uniref:Methyltransferase domain-containing protein n=1 Tax=Acetobacter oryzoeni TaxID=2500548 RepID=A0A5B9GHS0_9PROT|nr:methyltransferase domain-containing protein [Acetobacter oryzoeni]